MTKKMTQKYSALRLAMAGLVALAIAMGVGRFAFTPLLPMMQADAGLGLPQGGWLASANYLGYLLGALTAAFLPLAPAALLRWGLITVVLVTALMGLTSSWVPWLAWRFLAGVASAWVLVGTSAQCLGQLARLGQPGRAGVVFAGVGVGMALAGLLCMILGILQISSALAWLMFAGISAVAAAATLPLWQPAPDTVSSTPPSAPEPHAQEAPMQNKTSAVRHASLIFCYGLFGFGYILPATFIPAQARELIAEPAIFGLAWPIFGAAAALSTLLASRLARRYSRRTVWAASQLIMALGVLLPALLPSMEAIVVASLCVGGTFMVVTMVGMQEAQQAGAGASRRLIGAFSAAFAAGQLIGPLVFSIANTMFGASLESALVLAALALVCSTLILLKPLPNRKATT